MKINSRTILLFSAALAMVLPVGKLVAQEQLAGLCARVKIGIPQELTLERIGFEATLEVTNNDGEDPLTEFSARLYFLDPSKEPGDPDYDVTDRFFVQPPTFQNLNSVDGNGVIGPTKTGIAQWFIIPKIEAGGTDPRGKPYLVGCALSANIRGAEVPQEALLVVPEQITVVPDAQLRITYFQPQYVTGDDPFTPEVESPIPFTLGVLVKNEGYGPANNLKIQSQQPRIEENLQGLLLVARILGVRVMDQPLDETSLTVNLGTIQPGGTRKGTWEMMTSLSGIFTEFSATYRHAPELGGEETSVINSINAHFIIGEVLNDEPGRDSILDFLADTSRDGMPDTLFESEGQELPVNLLQLVTEHPLLGNVMNIDLIADIEGWGYFRLDDPAQGRLVLRNVVRSDGKILHPRNAWLEERYTPGRSARDYYLHVLDRVELQPYSYMVTYEPPPLDVTAPVTRLRFSGEVSEVGGQFFITAETQMFFTSEDESPVSIVYKLNDGDFRPALPFMIREPGTYVITYYATDAADNVEAEQTAVLVLGAGGPQVSHVAALSDGLYLRGNTLSVRSGEVVLQTEVAPNPLDVAAEVTVLAGTRAFPTVAGVPPTPTSRTDASLQVGGTHVDFYRYRLNGGAWSAERPVHQPLLLEELSGAVNLAIQGRPAVGQYPNPETALEVAWTVIGTAPDWRLTGAPSTPTRATALALTVARADANLFRWRPDASFYRAEQDFSVPVIVERVAAGERSLSFIGRVAGEWEEMDNPSTYRWLVDTQYGSDFDGITEVYSQSFAAVQGSTFSFVWDGRDTSGRLQAPGWYTVLIELTDTLGNREFVSELVQISDLAGTPSTVASTAVGPRNPHARSDRLVWQQRSSGAAWQIYARSLADDDGAPLALTVGALSQENPRTDGRYVVWQGRREDGGWDIRLVDLQDPDVISNITDMPARNSINPAVAWPWVVYQTRDMTATGAPWQLEAFNAVSGERFMVYPGQDDQVTPSIDAGRVVWRDLRDPGNGEIYYQNLETGETLRLTDDLFGQFVPVIRGNWIAWQDNREGQVEIFGYHLLEGREVRLTSGTGNKARPFIEGNWLVYEEDSFAFETANIHLLDLESLRSIPLTYDSANKSRPTLVSGRLVWQQGSAEPFLLRSAGLPALQPVFISSNAVAVTDAMVARYGEASSLLTAWQADAGITAISRYAALLPTPVVETVTWSGGGVAGSDFSLQAGSFLWVEFADAAVLDLGDRSHGSINLQAGLNAFSYDGFPLDYTAYQMVADLGLTETAALRLLEASTGLWRSVEVSATGELIGPDFVVPSVAVVLVEMRSGISDWSPR